MSLRFVSKIVLQEAQYNLDLTRISDIVRTEKRGMVPHVCEAILLRYLAKSGGCFACNTAGKSN